MNTCNNLASPVQHPGANYKGFAFEDEYEGLSHRRGTDAFLPKHPSIKPQLTTIRKFTDSLTFMNLPVFPYIDRGDFAIVKIEELGMQLPCQTPVILPDYFSIIVVPEGAATYYIGDQAYILDSDHILFIRPDTFLSTVWVRAKKAYNISFSKDFLSQFWPLGIDEIQKMDSAKGYAARLTKEMMENFESICATMYDEAVSQAPYKYELITNLIHNLLLMIRQQQHAGGPLKSAEQYNPYVNAFLKDLEENFSRIASGKPAAPLRIKDYAQMQNLNENYLSKVVSTTTGKTANQWIHEKFISEIKYLLKYTDRPMGEIASLFGFNDLNHFYNYFKRHALNAPGSFRKDCNRLEIYPASPQSKMADIH